MANRVTHSDTFKGLPIMRKKGGMIVESLEKTLKTLTDVLSHHSRILVIRIDFPKSLNPDFNMNQFLAQHIKRLRNQKDFKGSNSVQYILAREYTKQKGEHFHLAIIMKKQSQKSPGTQYDDVSKHIMESYNDKAWLWSEPGEDQAYSKTYFTLDRGDLDPVVRSKQQEEIQNAINATNKDDKAKGYRGISLGDIKKRGGGKANIAVGGIFDEVFFALSYLTKKAQKPENDGKRFTGSSSQPKPIEEWTSKSHKTLQEFINTCDNH